MAAGARLELHVLVAASAVRRERTRRRNEQRGEAYALRVSDDMFDASETWWEPPAPDELRQD